MSGLAPKLRFAEFRDSWNATPFKFLAKIYDGTHQTPNYVENGVPFYSVEHLTSDDFTSTKFISEEVYQEELKRVFIEKHDVLMTRIGDIGTTKFIDWEIRASFYVSLALFKFDKLKSSSSFMHHLISTDTVQKELHKRTIHVAFPKKINLGEIGECLGHIPSLPEQQKIADFLSAVDAKIDAVKRKRDAFERYKKGLMQQIFSQKIRFKQDDGSEFPEWEEKRLGDVAAVKTGSRDTQNRINNGKYPFFVRSDTIERIDTYAYDGEAILTSGDGVGVGKNIHYINGKFDYHQRVYAIYQFNPRLDGKFFYHYFKEHFYQRVIRLSAKNSVDSVRMSMITDMPIPQPAFPEQQKIADFLSAINAKIDAITSQVQKLEAFKKGLLQQMFV